MSEPQKDTPAASPVPAAASVTLPFLVDYPWPDVPNSQYEITQVGVHEGEVAAVCQCAHPPDAASAGGTGFATCRR